MEEMQVTRDAARAYFGDMGYRMITKGTIRVLVDMLKEQIAAAKANLPEHVSIKGVISSKVIYNYDENNLLKECFIDVKGEYFEQREGISFNDGGFIGFAGWADHWNAYPILMAFVEWVDYLKELEQMKVFKVSDMDWMAAPSEEVAKKFYMESMGDLSDEDIMEYWEGEQDIHEERMFYPIAGMDEGELDLFAPIHQWNGENCIKVPFSWVIRKNGSIEPYYIASTEY